MVKVTYYIKVVAYYDDKIDYFRTNSTLCTDFIKGEVSLSVIGSKNLKSADFTRKPKVEEIENVG